MPTDPFTILYDFLWKVLEANETLTSLVRASNRVKFADVLGFKEAIQHGDLPEIVIVPDGNSQDTMGTSGTGELQQSYKIFLSTADKRPEQLNQLKWQLYRALETFNANVGRCLFNGRRFVVIGRITSSSEAITDANQNRGINGWCAAWGLTVTMEFENSELIYSMEG